MNRLPFSWSSVPGALSLGPSGLAPVIRLSWRDGAVALDAPAGAATFRRHPRLLGWPVRRGAISQAEAVLGTLRLNGWLDQDGVLSGGSAHARAAAAAWMERHRPVLRRGLEALRAEGATPPWGLLGDDDGVHLCVVADTAHVLPLLSQPRS
jgi:hypothetical protein